MISSKERIVHMTDTVTFEGAAATRTSSVNLFLNSIFAITEGKQNYYGVDNSAQDFLNSMEEIAEADKDGYEFIAKMGLLSRHKFGRRYASYLVGKFLNDKTFEGKRDFYNELCGRADDPCKMLDMVGRPSHAMARGFADYLSDVLLGTLVKYKSGKGNVNMYDAINITHAHSIDIDDFKSGEKAPNANTWEVRISACSTQEEKVREWVNIVMSDILGPLAALRNICNVMDAIFTDNLREIMGEPFTYLFRSDNDLRISVLDHLTEAIMDRYSRYNLYPHQVYAAHKAFRQWQVNLSVNDFERKAVEGVEDCLECLFIESFSSFEKLDGDSLAVVDISGSMQDSTGSFNSSISYAEISAIMALALKYNNPDTDVCLFGTYAHMMTNEDWQKMDGIYYLDRVTMLHRDYAYLGYGTDMSKVWGLVGKHYDRIFIFSDVQVMSKRSWGWFLASDSGENEYDFMVNQYGESFVYSFDLAAYNRYPDSIPSEKMFFITSYSPEIFSLVPLIEDHNSKLYRD